MEASQTYKQKLVMIYLDCINKKLQVNDASFLNVYQVSALGNLTTGWNDPLGGIFIDVKYISGMNSAIRSSLFI